MLDIDKENPKESRFSPVLFKLKSLLKSSSSFELLSLDRMRSQGSRGKVDDIGMGGERLAAFIHGMNPYKKSELSKMVSEFIGYNVKITTTTIRPGWVEMFLEEVWDSNEIKVKKRYISDGLLRTIAFSAIITSLSGKTVVMSENYSSKGLIMLDEIEDGINPHLAEELTECFKKVAKEIKRQVVITSHSPVILNYVDDADIVFMWRDRGGVIHAKPLFQTKKMKETLEFLGPGEVWLNYPKERIVEKILHDAGGIHD